MAQPTLFVRRHPQPSIEEVIFCGRCDNTELKGFEIGIASCIDKYHFGTKDDLYRAIWTDRYAKTYGRRFDHLDAIDYSLPRDEIAEELAEALLSFMNGLSHAVTRRFAHLMAREIADPPCAHMSLFLHEHLLPRGLPLLAGNDLRRLHSMQFVCLVVVR